jgi:hypothetical protein
MLTATGTERHFMKINFPLIFKLCIHV